jgi:hypothetical protein
MYRRSPKRCSAALGRYSMLILSPNQKLLVPAFLGMFRIRTPRKWHMSGPGDKNPSSNTPFRETRV